MKQIFLILLLVVSYLGLIGQPLTAINSNVSGSKPTFVAQGDISATSDLGSEQYSITLVNRSELLGNSTFIATNSAIGDIIIDGNGGIYEIISGTSPTFTVQLLNDPLDLPEPFFGFPAAPTPPVNIARPIGNSGLLPSYAFLGSGLDSRLIAIIDNFNKNQIADFDGLAADGVVTGGSVSGTDLILTRSLGLPNLTIAGLPSGNNVDSVVFAYTTSQINSGFVSWNDGETLINITKKDTVTVHFSFNDNSITTLFNTVSNDSILVNYNEGNGWEKIAENLNVTKTFGTTSQRFLSVRMPKQNLITVDFLGGFNFNIAEFLVFENMTGIDIHDRNTVTGDINNLPPNIGTLDVRGNNTLYGSFTSATNLPTVFFRITGANTVTGDIADIPQSVVYFGLTGRINITGDIANMPPNLVHTDITGTSTFSGDLANIPTGLTGNFTLGGQNTITGDIANIPVGVSDVTISGNNTVFGNIANISAPYTRLVLTGQSAPTGALSDINNICTYIYIDTPNATITGDIADINAGTTFLYARGASTIEDYSGNPGWPSIMSGININCNTNFTTAELDSLLIDLDTATTSWNGVMLIAVNGAQARSAASNAAVSSLQSKGVTVTLN